MSQKIYHDKLQIAVARERAAWDALGGKLHGDEGASREAWRLWLVATHEVQHAAAALMIRPLNEPDST